MVAASVSQNGGLVGSVSRLRFQLMWFLLFSAQRPGKSVLRSKRTNPAVPDDQIAIFLTIRTWTLLGQNRLFQGKNNVYLDRI